MLDHRQRGEKKKEKKKNDLKSVSTGGLVLTSCAAFYRSWSYFGMLQLEPVES